MKAAVIQMNSQDQVEDNLDQAEQLVGAAARAGASLVLLPEGFAFLGAEADKKRYAESLSGTGPIMAALRKWAQAHQIHLIAGGMAEQATEGAPPFNSSIVLSPGGQLVASYRKMHLFDVDLKDGTRHSESRATSRGSAPSLVEIDGIGVGLSICYDLRFPEYYAWQRRHGAQILTVPAAFTKTTGEAHWHVLLRARAIENQCYVLASAQQGNHPGGRQTFGHALAIDPWGTPLAEITTSGPGFALAEIRLEVLQDLRQRMPIEQHHNAFFEGKLLG